MNKCIAVVFLIVAGMFGHMQAWSNGPNQHESFTGSTPSGCEQTNQCFAFSYKGHQVSLDGKQVTLTFSIKTNCNRDLSYAAFEIPSGETATATGTRKYTYNTSITNNPFRSIKFEGVGISGYKNGVSDEFKYIISKSAFDRLTTIKVQAKASSTVGTVTFNKICTPPVCTFDRSPVTNVVYTVNGTNYNTLEGNAVQGKPVKVCFTVAAGAPNRVFSFVSYTSPLPTYSAELADQQVVFDYRTIVVDAAGGRFCMEIAVPNCYFQVDFVRGCIIEKLGPAGTNNFYGVQGRLIEAYNNGTTPCVPNETTGNEGCTPGYWKQDQHFGNWSPSIPTGTNATKFFDVFTVCDMNGNNCNYRGLPADLTLLQALKLGGGGFAALARHAAAAYLNARSTAVDYSITLADIVSNVVKAFKTGDASYKDVLEKANEKGCPLGRAEATPTAIAPAARDNALGVEENSLSAVPNPFIGKTTINFTLPVDGRYNVGLFDAQGKQVRNLNSGIGKAGEQRQVILESAGLQRGMYLVQLRNGTHTKTIKVVVQQ